MTLEQFEAMLAVCRSDRDKAIVMVLMDTGIRAAELCNIRVEDIDFNAILIAQGKGRKPRTVFIGKRTRRQVRKLHSTGYLFTNREGGRLRYPALRQILRRLCIKAGFSGISPHDFRRGYAIESLRRGMDLLTLSRLLGHTSLSLLSRYVRQTNLDLNHYQSILD